MAILQIDSSPEEVEQVRRELRNVLAEARAKAEITPKSVSLATGGNVSEAQVSAFIGAGIGSLQTIYKLELAAESLGLWPVATKKGGKR